LAAFLCTRDAAASAAVGAASSSFENDDAYMLPDSKFICLCDPPVLLCYQLIIVMEFLSFYFFVHQAFFCLMEGSSTAEDIDK